MCRAVESAGAVWSGAKAAPVSWNAAFRAVCAGSWEECREFELEFGEGKLGLILTSISNYQPRDQRQADAASGGDGRGLSGRGRCEV